MRNVIWPPNWQITALPPHRLPTINDEAQPPHFIMSDEPRLGRPKGRKDGPRKPNAPPRGPPTKQVKWEREVRRRFAFLHCWRFRDFKIILILLSIGIIPGVHNKEDDYDGLFGLGVLTEEQVAYIESVEQGEYFIQINFFITTHWLFIYLI
jgi:hypothetical protein